MPETTPLPTPADGDWSWAPERAGFGGYAGTCTIGPFTFTVTAKQRFAASAGWELHGNVKLVGVSIASHTWETDSLSCTPDGILAEIGRRDVLYQLADAARRQVAEAARLLEEFDLISRAYSPPDKPSS